ncbi:MAG: DUF4229 domain-containing protein [Micromonosporaceae bacterium]
MSPALKYSLGRIGIFVAVAVLVVLLLPVDSLLVKLLVAILVSAVLSFFLLRRWRDELAAQIQAGAGRRSQEKARLRDALAGDAPAGDDRQPGPDAPAERPPTTVDGDDDPTGQGPPRLS